VSRSPDLGLGLRLAIGAGRRGLARLFLIAIGIALAVGLLFTALGIFWAEEAVDERETARQFLHARRSGSPDHLLVEYADTAFGDRPITIRFLAAVGEPSPPPWLERLPEPGEIVASRALADLLASDVGAVLRPRLPGVVVDTLADQWTLHPGELVAYVGVERGELRTRRASIVVGYGRENQGVDSGASGFAVDQPLTQVLFLVSVGLLIPIVVFVATGARLSASARESRLAAIRLVGATPAQIRVVAAAESLLAAAVGCAVGGVLFLVARPIIAAEAPPGNRWFASDIAPPGVVFGVVVIGVMALSVAVSLFSLRRVVVTPLGVVRKEGRPIRHAWRWLMLAVGLGGLLVVMLSGRAILANDRIALPFVVICYGFAGIGAAASAPLAGSAIATLIARMFRGTGVMLGARRLRADPRTAGRTVAGVVIVVMAATVTSLYVGLYEAEAGDSAFPSSLEPSTVIVESLGDPRFEYGSLVSVQGVHGVAPIWRGYTNTGNTVMITNCDALDKALRGNVPPCRTGDALVNGSLHGRRLRPTLTVGLETGSSIRVQVDPNRIGRFRSQLGWWAYNILVPLDAADPSIQRWPPSAIFVATDGAPATLERIRNELFLPSIGIGVRPRGEPLDYVDEVPVLVGGAVTLGLLITFAIAAATLLITSVDAVGERRRSLAALAAVGASRGVLREALAIETALPMLAGVALGLSSAIGGTWMVWRAVAKFEEMDQPPPIHWRSLGAVVAFAVVAIVLATVATFPSLGRAIRPDSLRTE
jgi:ABC-type antimicrobial peptide transport system permease subunit